MLVRPSAERSEAPAELRQALRACRRHFVLAAVFSAVVNILFVTPTLYLMHVYDQVLTTRGVVTLVLLSGLTAIALLVQAMMDYLRARVLVRAGARLDEAMGGALVSSVLTTPGAGGVQAVRELDILRQGLSGAGLLALLDLPWAPFYLVLLFFLHPLLCLLAAVGGAVLFGLALLNVARTRDASRAAMDSATRGYAVLGAAAETVETVRALGMSRALASRHMRDREAMIAAQTDAAFTGSFYSSVIKGLRLFLQSAAVGLGALLVINDQMSAGMVMASAFLLARALAPIEQATTAWPTLERTRLAYQSLKTAIVGGRTGEAPTRLPAPKGVITLEGVTVMTPDRSRQSLTTINLRFDPGMIVGVSGESGSGKSTLARVMAGALEPDLGVVRLDGAALDQWDPEQLARHIGYLPQNFTLYEGSIKDNISRFRGAVDPETARLDDMVIEAAQAAGCHEMILQLPHGYDTPLGPGGAGLSGGQAQRVALARALFGRPQVLILDEPNAHLDARAEQYLLATLKAYRLRGGSVVVFAHSRSVLATCDRLVLLNRGRLDVVGSLEEIARMLRERQAAAGSPAAPPPPRAANSPQGEPGVVPRFVKT